MLVFGDSFKRKTINMTKIIFEKTARAVGILVSALFLQHIKFAVYFVLDIVLNIKQFEGNVILI